MPESIPVDDHACYQFKEGHPNCETHAVFKLKNDKSYVLNFVGGTLPRRDKGDREMYCMVMSVLFRPGGWRTGKEIKQKGQTWEEAFQNTQFDDRHLKMMRNMNLLYECYDYAHDLAVQRKKDADTEHLPTWLPDDLSITLITQHTEEEYQVGCTETDILDIVSQAAEKFGKHFGHIHTQINDMKLKVSGLLRGVESSTVEQIPSRVSQKLVDCIQLAHKTPQEWKAELDTAKEHAITERFTLSSRIDTNGHTITTHADNPNEHIEGAVTVTTQQLVNQEYGVDSTKPDVPYHIILVSQLIREFQLNKEQCLAFKIIAAHLLDTTARAPHLRMYIGGMGGTGKSRVIKCVLEFLRKRNESHRYMVMAPTGSAACLIDGSTIHSMLGLGINGIDATQTHLDQLMGRLKLVDLLIVDEISMVSCKDLYRMSSQLSTAFQSTFDSFGNKHMVIAGDFGQLPPPGAASLSLYSPTMKLYEREKTLEGQKNALGKALWQQFTTVIILR